METNPLVSVIIPTFNRADQLSRAVESVRSQTYINKEIIVVDDGSTDSTFNIVKTFTDVHYFKIVHGGQAAARNFGLHHSSGSLIASLDSDDKWLPNFLAETVSALVKNDLDFVFANWLQRSKYEKIAGKLSSYQPLIPYLEKVTDDWVALSNGDLRYLYTKGCYSPSSSTLIKRSAIIAGWNPGILVGDDWYLLLDSIINNQSKAAVCRKILWEKNSGDSNVYDGRAWNEVIQNLYVKDLSRFIRDFGTSLTKEEKRSLGQLHQEGLVKMSFYTLLKKRDITAAASLFLRSVVINPIYTFRMLPEVYRLGVDMKRKSEMGVNPVSPSPEKKDYRPVSLN